MSANCALEHLDEVTRKALQNHVEVELLRHLYIANGPVERQDLMNMATGQITVRIRGQDCAVLNGWCMAGPTLIIKHFALSKPELKKLGYGKAIAKGLAALAQDLGVASIVFDESHPRPEHSLLFGSISGITPFPNSVWVWTMPRVHNTTPAEASMMRAIQLLAAELGSAEQISSVLSRLEMQKMNVQTIQQGMLVGILSEIKGTESILRWAGDRFF